MHKATGDPTTERIASLVMTLLRARGVQGRPDLEATLTDQGLTSLDMVNLVLSVEGEFGIQLDEAVITPATFKTIASIKALVESTLVTPAKA